MASEIEADGAEEGARKKGGNGLLVTFIVLLLLGGGGFGAWKVFGAKAADKEPPLLPARYITLDPPFVVNFEAEAAVRFLQVAIGVMTRDPAIEQIVKDNDPRVRNDMLMILSGQSYASVSTTEGKEALREKCLEAVRAIVTEMRGDPAKIEALYFTSFVMQ